MVLVWGGLGGGVLILFGFGFFNFFVLFCFLVPEYFEMAEYFLDLD